ncbi:hypothetical protein PCASD_01264 [Puccinia coronata f. sp. avenae]|uniref:Uncharacterized protein n=1 Tax=Puccinia coronata f. sp. avenae TaxID=200324 RepID=A0A2N5VIY1_9BASI|nr:hypothetical protein PCASD_20303 [Puccinia coronata f. sp. avenae]PLW49953.1 hypothetical protein PCASD_01264 [Puccinia coronata f. sp. avenae]
MSNKDQPKTTNPNPSTTKERIDEQIGALKDALPIPFLASPPQSSHDGTRIPAPPTSQQPQVSPHSPPTTQQTQIPPHFHYTPTPYVVLPTSNTLPSTLFISPPLFLTVLPQNSYP